MDVAARLGIAGLHRAGVEFEGGCPVCGDDGKRTANRFAINPAKNIFLCRRCDVAGDGLQLVQFVQDCSFPEAITYLVGVADVAPDPALIAARKKKNEAAEKSRREYAERARAFAIRDAREIWHSAEGGDVAQAVAYLVARGVRFPVWPPTLRFLPDHPYVKTTGGQLRTLHRGPCMVAAIQCPAGQVRAVHRTWIDPVRPGKKAKIIGPDGAAMPAKMVRGSKKGGAIRLTALGTSGVLIMGEGIETTASALTAGVYPTAAFWAGVDLGNMSGRQNGRNTGEPDLEDTAAFLPPDGVSRLVFIQDGDSDPTTTRAKLLAGLRRAVVHRPGLQVQIVHAGIGRDLNDLINNPQTEEDPQ